MTNFQQYAALVRELSARHRAAEQAATVETQRRQALRDAAARLDRRLAGQREWLTGLGTAIGAPAPPVPAPAPASGRPDRGTAAPAPRPGAAHPPGPAPRLALSTTGTPSVPAPTTATGHASAGPTTGQAPAGPTTGQAPAGPAASPPVDPAEELARAERRADDADRHGRRVEALAAQPRLLPDRSPLLRAVVVYLACAAVGVLPLLGLVIAYDTGHIDEFTLGAWASAGLPATCFVTGFLLIGRYGRPVLGGGDSAPRHPRAGFLICFLLLPLLCCAYFVLTG